MAVNAIVDSDSLARGLTIKRWNALTAVLAGGVPAVLLSWWKTPRISTFVLAFCAGLLWANGFEYVYHRWLLHWPGSSFARGHLRHHASVGRPNAPEHVGLGGSPLAVLALFVANGAPIVGISLGLHAAFAPGMLAAFAVYFILTEEVHWRFHIGGWVPAMLEAQRQRHLDHHDIPSANFAIFLPFFDYILGTASNPNTAPGHSR